MQAMQNRGRNNVSGEEDDLLEQKKTLQEGVFSAMHLLARSRSADSWKFAAVKVLLEGLIPFLVIFNPTNGWDIHPGNPVWQGYHTYVRIFYAFVVVVYVAVTCIAFLTLAMRRQARGGGGAGTGGGGGGHTHGGREHSKALRRFAVVLQTFTEVVFSLFYMSVFDYMVFLFNCKFLSKGPKLHNYWPEVHCFETPHLIHLSVAGVTAVVFFCSTALMLVAGCDLNPVARGIMSSPAAVTRIKVLVMKAVYVIVVNTLDSAGKVQAVLMTAAALAITWYNLSRLPFLRYAVNLLWVGGWAAVTFTCAIYCVLEFHPRHKEHGFNSSMVMLVLYGVWPSIAAGAGVTALWHRYRLRDAGKFASLDPAVKLRKVHQFSSPEDVELLSRSMRVFDGEGGVLEEFGNIGETIIKCGIAVYPGDVGLLVLYANFLMEVRRDGPVARTQLQLALKSGPR
ncbi:hypothetical protein GPECTOR_45g149 [Gonium pectorale]|uniref:Uncharacterized protein n=1 Tax=Gonium pectorale TaxID=33097 RepID=A0A150G8U4_GONPE|nr:hypothetical protein GPECTOR_45g149 [Gonium pectorale]|eukprot:KXZ46279.1 hypothetical protein GPECTOR_45g149 [Gonium pectorale]